MFIQCLVMEDDFVDGSLDSDDDLLAGNRHESDDDFVPEGLNESHEPESDVADQDAEDREEPEKEPSRGPTAPTGTGRPCRVACIVGVLAIIAALVHWCVSCARTRDAREVGGVLNSVNIGLIEAVQRKDSGVQQPPLATALRHRMWQQSRCGFLGRCALWMAIQRIGV